MHKLHMDNGKAFQHRTTMEGSALLEKRRGDQVAATVEANGRVGQEADQLASTVCQASLDNGKKTNGEAHEHNEGSVAEIHTQPSQPASGDDTEASAKAHGSSKPEEAHEETASNAQAIQEICANCLQPAPVKCVQCKSTWYCSRECQRIDWTIHKHLCRKFKDFQTRPEPNLVRAIYFPEDDKDPRFVWLKQNDDPLDLEYMIEKFELGEVEKLLVADDGEVTQQYVTRSIRQDRRTDKVTARVYLLMHHKSFTNGSRPNKSIGWITKGNFHFSWRGPMVAVLTRFDESEENQDEAVLEDTSMVDFRDLVDYFNTYGKLLPSLEDFGALSFWWLPQSLKDELKQQRQIKVVEVKSDVEYKHSGTKYQEALMGEGHPAMAYLQPCPVTGRLGLPLVLRRKPVEDGWKNEVAVKGNANYGAHLLLLDVNPQSPNWGMTAGFSEQGTVLVMRHDGKDLHAHHVEAMIMYLLQVVSEAMKESVEGRRSKSEVLDLMHPSRLDWYFHRYRKEKVAKEESWKDSPPLFDMVVPALDDAVQKLAGLGF